MDVFIKIAQLLLSLSILIIFHEFGHYIAARIFKTRVEKFYLFFDPWFSLIKFKKGDTTYGIGWLPLGGYVKISGMIDESMDKEAMALPPKPYEFRSKPAWQRLIIMLGGVTVNVILAFLIYIGIMFTWGEQYLPTSEANKYGLVVDSLGMELGLQNGDQIVSVDNEEVENFLKIPGYLLLNKAQTIQIIRNGVNEEIIIDPSFYREMKKKRIQDMLFVQFPFEVHEFPKKSAARDAGLEVGDKIIGLNDVSTPYFHDFRMAITELPEQEVMVKLLREGDTLQLPVMTDANGLIGIAPKPLDQYFEFAEKNYNLIEAIPVGFSKTYKGIANYLKQLKLLFDKDIKAYESIGGFITIGSIFPDKWDWEMFWSLTAFLSIMLAILNILPIPALDGGHVMFLLYEIIAGRKPSDKFMEYAQIVGLVMLFALLIFANGNDILRLFRN